MESRDKLPPAAKGEAALRKIQAARRSDDVDLNVLLGDVLASNDAALLRRLVHVLADKEETTGISWIGAQERKAIAERIDSIL